MMQRQSKGASAGTLGDPEDPGSEVDLGGPTLAPTGSQDLDPAVAAERRSARQAGKERSERTTPARFLREVRNELRQVAWPTRSELANYTAVVVTVLVVMIALIFALNYGFGKAVLWLFQQ